MADPIENIKRRVEYQNKKSSISADASLLEFGKLPPQAKELEEAVLGALMIEKNAMDEVAEILKEESFYVEAHQYIFRAIKQLFVNQNPIDMLTVVERLKQNGDLEKVGGPYMIAQLTNKVASAANVEYHSRIIAQKYVQRMLISTSSDVIK